MKGNHLPLPILSKAAVKIRRNQAQYQTDKNLNDNSSQKLIDI